MEITLAVVVAAVCAIPILYLISSTRTDTAKAINYLRAMELANEALEWCALVPFDKLANFKSTYSEPLPATIHTGQSTTWPGLMHSIVAYCQDHGGKQYKDQYDKCYFRRDLDIEDRGQALGYPAGTVALAVVTVGWNEAREADPTQKERMRKIVLGSVIFNETFLDY